MKDGDTLLGFPVKMVEPTALDIAFGELTKESADRVMRSLAIPREIIEGQCSFMEKKPCMGDSANIIKVALQHDWSKSESKTLQAIAEIGVHRGATSKLLLQTFPKATLYMIDSWCSHGTDSRYRKSGDGIAKLTNEQQEWNYRDAVDAVSFAGMRACVIRSSAKLAARSLRDKFAKLGLVFLDGDHTYEGVKEDIAWWWPLVERGGILSGHDFGHRRFEGVQLAVDEFAAETGLTYKLMGSVWWVVKP